MSRAILVDTTKCISCRGCQVACKQSHNLPAERTYIEGRATAFQNPIALSAKTMMMITMNEIEEPKAPGGLKWVFAKRQCMHCESPACASACPVTALHKTKEGPVNYDSSKCLGCRYCVWACPFGVPTADWDSLAPQIVKCTMCYERITDTTAPAAELNGAPLTGDAQARIAAGFKLPACVKTCPTGCLKFGDRDALIAEARKRMADAPDRYIDHIYGETEAGGTCYIYISNVQFEKLGFRTDLGARGYPSYSAGQMGAVAPAVIGVGAILGGIYMLQKRREEVASKSNQGKKE